MINYEGLLETKNTLLLFLPLVPVLVVHVVYLAYPLAIVFGEGEEWGMTRRFVDAPQT